MSGQRRRELGFLEDFSDGKTVRHSQRILEIEVQRGVAELKIEIGETNLRIMAGFCRQHCSSLHSKRRSAPTSPGLQQGDNLARPTSQSPLRVLARKQAFDAESEGCLVYGRRQDICGAASGQHKHVCRIGSAQYDNHVETLGPRLQPAQGTIHFMLRCTVDRNDQYVELRRDGVGPYRTDRFEGDVWKQARESRNSIHVSYGSINITHPPRVGWHMLAFRCRPSRHPSRKFDQCPCSSHEQIYRQSKSSRVPSNPVVAVQGVILSGTSAAHGRARNAVGVATGAAAAVRVVDHALIRRGDVQRLDDLVGIVSFLREPHALTLGPRRRRSGIARIRIGDLRCLVLPNGGAEIGRNPQRALRATGKREHTQTNNHSGVFCSSC